MYACHKSANYTANILPCQLCLALSLLPYICYCEIVESKDGFDSRARYQTSFDWGWTALLLLRRALLKPPNVHVTWLFFSTSADASVH